MERAGVLPSGEQHEISRGDQRAVIVEVGGALRSYQAGGRELLDGYPPDERCTGARGQTLIPWPNRLEDGKYAWDGEELQVALTEPEKHNAIHGLVRWANWRRLDRSDDRLVMTHTLHPQPGYPFTLRVLIEYTLSADGLRVRTAAENLGECACPVAMGAHPYLSVGAEKIDSALLRLPGRSYLPVDERGLPTGQKPVAGSRYDFRTPRKIGETEIDVAYTDLDRDLDGRAWVELVSSDGKTATTLWLDSSYRFLEIFTGDTLQLRPRRGLGVEPMTAAPNAFRSGNGLRRLAPGERLEASWGIIPGKRPRSG